MKDYTVNENTVILSCSCGARFKIRNPQPGAKFQCNRCGSTIIVPGEKLKDTQKLAKPDIVKIELHKPSFRQADQRNTLKGLELPRTTKQTETLPTIPQTEDALDIKDKNSGRFVKKIFASDVQNRQRLLYLISLYSKSSSYKELGQWIRKIPLQVFMFEGVITEVFDWDYAPSSTLTADGRAFINISQEGEEDLFALLSGEYVYNLKLTTTQHRNITAYQITEKGKKFLEKINSEDKKAIDELTRCPECSSYLTVAKKQTDFYFACTCGFKRESSITTAEDVSYFCIPYFPPTLTSFEYQPSLQIKKRLEHYFNANPSDNIKDTLEELIYISDAKVLVGEWIPFGSNHMAALNYKLGSNERVQSAKFTQEVDTSPDGTTIEIPESFTLVKVRDYSLASYVDFEAFIYLPEDPEIIQIEEFAVHIDSNGHVRYGLEILAVNERDHDRISLDHLPRILVDILQDSTTILDTLLTNYQKSLLDLIFQGKSSYRDKYFFVLANDIHCFQEEEGESISEELMKILSQKNYQDELNQVTEEVKETALFADGTVFILGSHGSILVTRTPEKYEQLVSDFLFTMDIELFLNNFFTRLFLMNDELKDIQNLIKNCETDPNAITMVQKMLSRTSSDAIMMEEVRRYLQEAVLSFQEKFPDSYKNYGEEMDEAINTFKIREMTKGLAVRIKDMEKIIKGTQESLQGLTRVTDVISERQMRRIQEALSHNTRSLEDITKTNERSGMSLRILEIILAGGLAFNIMDQFTGEWSISQDAFIRPLLQNLFDIPGVWLIFSIGLWAFLAFGIFVFMKWLEKIHSKAIIARIKLDLPCNIENLHTYLKRKNIITHNADIFNISNVIKVVWEESPCSTWLNNKVKIELVYDEKNGFLLSTLIEINTPNTSTTLSKIQEILITELKDAQVL